MYNIRRIYKEAKTMKDLPEIKFITTYYIFYFIFFKEAWGLFA